MFGVGFIDTAGIEVSSEKTQSLVKIGSGNHEAIQRHIGLDCAVSIAIAEKSSVDILVVDENAINRKSLPESQNSSGRGGTPSSTTGEIRGHGGNF
jgi:hypothetical protein